MELNHHSFINELVNEITGFIPSLKNEWEDNYQEYVQFVDIVDDHSKDLFQTSMAPTWDLFLKQIDLVLDEMDKDPNLYGYIYVSRDDKNLNAALTSNPGFIESIKEFSDPTSNPKFFISWD